MQYNNQISIQLLKYCIIYDLDGYLHQIYNSCRVHCISRSEPSHPVNGYVYRSDRSIRTSSRCPPVPPYLMAVRDPRQGPTAPEALLLSQQSSIICSFSYQVQYCYIIVLDALNSV